MPASSIGPVATAACLLSCQVPAQKRLMALPGTSGGTWISAATWSSQAVPLGQVHRHEPGVDELKGSGREVGGGDVGPKRPEAGGGACSRNRTSRSTASTLATPASASSRRETVPVPAVRPRLAVAGADRCTAGYPPGCAECRSGAQGWIGMDQQLEVDGLPASRSVSQPIAAPWSVRRGTRWLVRILSPRFGRTTAS